MSSKKRPWYKWWVKDFNQDEKVKGLSWDAELIYRRLLDVMWQSNECQLPNDTKYLINAVAFAKGKDEFLLNWSQIQRPKFELFTVEGDWIYSKRLKKEMEEATKLANKRKKYGKRGGLAKGKAKATAKLKQKGSDTDTDTDSDIKDKSNDGQKAVLEIKELDKFAMPEIRKNVKKIGEELYKSKIFEKVWPFINKCRKHNINERTILHALTRCYLKATTGGGFKGMVNKKDRTPWGYCLSIIKVEDGNYNEREFQKDKT